MYWSRKGCCICRARFSNSQLSDSKWWKDFQSCLPLHETPSEDFAAAEYYLWKERKYCWQDKKTKQKTGIVVGTRAGSSLNSVLTPKKVKSLSGNKMKKQPDQWTVRRMSPSWIWCPWYHLKYFSSPIAYCSYISWWLMQRWLLVLIRTPLF